MFHVEHFFPDTASGPLFVRLRAQNLSGELLAALLMNCLVLCGAAEGLAEVRGRRPLEPHLARVFRHTGKPQAKNRLKIA